MLATIINFSSNEASFLTQCVEEALFFSDQIVVCFADHFFDGAAENLPLIYGIAEEHPEITFIQYPFSKENFYGDHPPSFWHNMSRMIGYHHTQGEYLLFLDVDEIAEGKRFARWLETTALIDAMRLANYWYFREAKYRAKTIEDTPLLVRRGALEYEGLMHEKERAGLYHVLKGKKKRLVGQEAPFFHHYSWVRNKEQMLRKVRSWGHRGERDWEKLVMEEFEGEFSGIDFVHGYAFEEVEPKLLTCQYKPVSETPKNVRILSTRDVHKMDLTIGGML
ncbi:MAG: hypothetical protein P0S96_00140 [Simkaniaceae bacterium]|nr:hypothetical protein [Candidatus Sacchlamyda saccharinae]